MCNQPGHKSNKCPFRKPINLVENLDNIDSETGDYVEVEKGSEGLVELVDEDQGEPLLCIVQKLLTDSKTK